MFDCSQGWDGSYLPHARTELEMEDCLLCRDGRSAAVCPPESSRVSLLRFRSAQAVHTRLAGPGRFSGLPLDSWRRSIGFFGKYNRPATTKEAGIGSVDIGQPSSQADDGQWPADPVGFLQQILIVVQRQYGQW